MTTQRAELVILSLADHLIGCNLSTRDRAQRPLLEGGKNETLELGRASHCRRLGEVPAQGNLADDVIPVVVPETFSQSAEGHISRYTLMLLESPSSVP